MSVLEFMTLLTALSVYCYFFYSFRARAQHLVGCTENCHTTVEEVMLWWVLFVVVQESSHFESTTQSSEGAVSVVRSTMAFAFLRGLGRMFYISDFSEFMHEGEISPTNYISDAIPYFFLFIICEAIYAMTKINPQVQFNTQESICSISLGMVQQSADILLRGISLFPYVYVYENFRIVDMPLASPWCNILLFLGVDMGYYWMHRCAHEWHFMWIGHSVHHTGEYYNFATALRQGTTQAVFSRFFYLPLAILGFPFYAYAGHNQLNTLYQFWIHTEVVNKLGVLEVFFNTPSHHRMHHRPPGNCNYAGVLIIWDRMFGTFVEEKERKDIYGLAKPLNSFNPLFANYQHALRMMSINNHGSDEGGDVKTREFSLRYFLSIFFTHRHYHKNVFRPFAVIAALTSPSAWSLTVPFSSPLKSREKYGTAKCNHPLRAVKIYTTINFVVTLLTLLPVLLKHKEISYYHVIVLLVVPIWSLVSIGMLNECNPYSLKTETRRVLVVVSWLSLYAFAQCVSSMGYGYPSDMYYPGGTAVVGVKFSSYVLFLESPFYFSYDLLTAPLCVMYAVMIFSLWIVTRKRMRFHYPIVSEYPKIKKS